MRLIDADALKELILKERDAIPKTVVERYAFGVESPNHHGNSMRGGIRKALRCMEQTPTIDPESLRPKGRKERSAISETGLMCTNCYSDVDMDAVFCKYCGAKMEG